MKFEAIIEKGDGEFWGRVKAKNFLPVTVADTIEEVLANLKMLIADHIEHEGKDDEY